MKNFFTLLFLFFLTYARATNYYFSAVSGDDSRSSIQARSPSTPWKTTGKLNSFFSSLQPGDSVLLKRGETFFGSITVTKSGTAALPIVIGAYGTGNKPVITSLVTLTGWVSKGNGIWESYNSSLGTTLNTVLLNGVAQEMGRYPNSNVANKGYLILESHTSNSITDNELNSSPNWTNAELVIRKARWVTDRCTITNHSGNTITFTGGSSYSPRDKFGYFIQNDIKTLDKLGEWYYNPLVKKLSVYFGSNTPSSYVIQATTISNLITASNFRYVAFVNLNVKGANSNGINIKEGSNIAIKNCDISFSGVNGVSAYYHPRFTIENCTITNSNDNGITMGYSGDNAVIRNNKITNTSIFVGMGGNGDSKGFGIYCVGKGTTIEYNEIRNTGYVGINFNGDYTIVKNNVIDSFCLIKDDGSAIYTFTGSANNVTYTGRKIIGNVILNGVGTPEGVSEYAPLVEGIYMDDNASGVEISSNTVANIPGKGIFLHNARNMVVTNNTVFNNTVQLCTQHDAKGDAIKNCTITKNIFFAKLATQDVADFRSIANDNGLMGRFDSNYYARPIDDRIIINNSYVNSSAVRVTEDLDLEEWQAKYNIDKASKRTAKQISTYKLNRLIGSNKFANGTFTSSKKGIFTTSCTASLSSAGQLEGSYLEVQPSATYSSVFVDIGPLKANTSYILRYTIKGAADNIYFSAALRKKLSPYTVLTPLQHRKVDRTKNNIEMAFLSTTTEEAAQIVFKSDDKNKYFLDNVEVYEADATLTNIDDSIRFVYNTSNVDRLISLAGNYVDAKNNKYSNSITLKPFTSAALIKNGVENKAPSVSITSPAANATFASPATITISANASDDDGTISKVDFYNGNTLLGSDNSSPYTFTWNNVATGNYTITAKATDNGSLVTTSTAVAISVYTPNVAPSVSVTSPAANATFASPATITLSANASDDDGTISKVDFYNGSTLLGSDNSSPYTFTWNNVATGNYTITAKATDNGSLVTTSEAVTISVYTPNIAPSVSLTSPVATTKYTAYATVIISANASDTDGTVSKVEFYRGTTLLQTVYESPYTYTWTKVAAGNYTITAKATDNNGLETVSDAVTITVVQNKAPVVEITSPLTNTNYTESATIFMSASAIDVDGTISKVDFYNGSTLLTTERSVPYTFTWNNVASGSYTITAKATDNRGATKSASVNITVATRTASSRALLKSKSDTMNNVYAYKLELPTIGKEISRGSFDLKVYPNPAANKITINIDGLLRVKQKAMLNIQNLSGITLKSIPVIVSGKTIEADISTLKTGLYSVSIICDNVSITRKFMKN